MIYDLDNKKVSLIGKGHFIAPGAVVIGDVTLMENANIWFNCVLRGDSERLEVGEGTNIQDGTVMHADPGFPLILGKDITVGHNVMLHGCQVGDGSLIGINSVVLNGVTIGKGCLIGANSLLTEGTKIPDGSLVMGSPAKVKRQLTKEQQNGLLMNAYHYVENSAYYLENLSERV